MAHIVIADMMQNEVVESMKQLGRVSNQPSNLRASLADADVLVVRSATKVNEELLSFAPQLKIVARAGMGLDNVDAAACKGRGIKVINTPGASSNAVAELVICFMLSFSRRIPQAAASMKNKAWLKKELEGSEIQGKKIGIVGLGRIGALVALKAKGLGMDVIYYDPRQPASALGRSVSLEEIFASSDFITLHVPLLPETKNMVNAAMLSKMKKTAVLINTARGALVDEEALFEALKGGRIAGACLDVYSQEPYNGKLCELDNVVLTPHIAGSTHEGQSRIGAELVERLKEELK